MHPSIRGVAQLCELNVSSTTVAARVKDDRYKIILAKRGNVQLRKARIVGIKSFLSLGNNQNEMGTSSRCSSGSYLFEAAEYNKRRGKLNGKRARREKEKGNRRANKMRKIENGALMGNKREKKR